MLLRDERELLPSLYKKEQLSDSRFALGHKKGGNCEKLSKTFEKYVLFE